MSTYVTDVSFLRNEDDITRGIGYLEHTSVVRERTFPLARILDILDMIRLEGTTGTLILDVSSGGISNVRLREVKKFQK